MSHIHLIVKALADVNVSPGSLPQPNADSKTLKNILDVFFGIIGGLALLFMTIAGLRYTLSAGNPESASKAKNGIIYALVGLIIALAGGAIVSFLLGNL